MLTAAPSRFGKRHRRIAWTAGVLATAMLTFVLVSWKMRRDSREHEYTPGEASADITTSVADNAARTASAAIEPVRSERRQVRNDSLRDPGQKLPAGAPPPRFSDVTRSAGLADFRTFAGSRSSQLPEDMGGGVAWGDFDNDGYEDLFLVSAGGPTNAPPARLAESMLFRNRGDGSFERAPFPELRIFGMGAAWADYNGDGWLDLAVSGYNTLLLFRNERGTFVRDRALPSPPGFWTGIGWGDFDNDRRPDLYVCGYVRYVIQSDRSATSTQQFGLEVPYTLNPASFEAERNLLFRNNGRGKWTESAAALGVDNPQGRSLSALWHDFNEDGWQDLYVANDISENKLYLNRAGKFIDAGHAAWVAEYRGSMGLAASDFDRDGDDDLFISHWVAQQFALYQSLLAENRKAGLAGEVRFTDVAEMAGVGQPSLQKIGWGASFADFDADGWPDLAVANGSTFESKDNSKRLVPMESFLFWNGGKRFFHDLGAWNRSLSAKHVSRGLAVADYDNDGAMDIAIVDLDGGVRLLHNEMPQGNWIELRLRSRLPGAGAHGFGDGAVVIATVNGKTMRRAVSSASYLSQDSRRVHLGLGPADTVERLEVRWPGGKPQVWTEVAANRIWDLEEGVQETKAFEAAPAAAAPAPQLGRAELAAFWAKQRAAMDAMKRQNDIDNAARLFAEALAINPVHEDSHYYLANCRIARGDVEGALKQLDELARINPSSHRAWQRRGVLLAASGRLDTARESLERALRINPEETGTLLLLGEVALAAGKPADAEKQLELACRTNPRAVGGLFLRGYSAWRRGALAESQSLLRAAATARGPEWKPKGSVAEGDVQRRMYAEAGFLAPFWEEWDGSADPVRSYAKLQKWLSEHRSQRR